jgi:hypothetical protein
MSTELDQVDEADEATTPGLPPMPGDMPMGAGIPLPEPARPFTAENVPCLRDCRHFMTLKTYFEHANPAGTFPDGAPLQMHSYCSAMSGTEPLELTADAPVYECNRWDPMQASEIHNLWLRRQEYLNCQEWQPMPNTTTEGHDDTSTPGDGPQ